MYVDDFLFYYSLICLIVILDFDDERNHVEETQKSGKK